jgi:hypothetical protein
MVEWEYSEAFKDALARALTDGSDPVAVRPLVATCGTSRVEITSVPALIPLTGSPATVVFTDSANPPAHLATVTVTGHTVHDMLRVDSLAIANLSPL